MPECETCEERGITRKGTHEVGNGWLCEACWSGKPIHQKPKPKAKSLPFRPQPQLPAVDSWPMVPTMAAHQVLKNEQERIKAKLSKATV